MPIIHIGHKFEVRLAILEQLDSSIALDGLAISSELSMYSNLQPSRRLPNGTKIRIPDYLVDTLNSIYVYGPNSSWSKVLNFTQNNNIITLTEQHSGILLGFPFDTFSDNFYSNGQYIYELFMSRTDTRIYKNITVSVSTHLLSNYITLKLAMSKAGPWYNKLEMYSIVPSFFMQVEVSNFNELDNDIIVPSETINLSCLVCE